MPATYHYVATPLLKHYLSSFANSATYSIAAAETVNTEEKMKAIAFSCFLFLLFLGGYSLPSKQQDIYEYLWNNNMDIATKTLQVDFLRQMQRGSLQAERYVNFTLQDINYLLNVTKMLQEMSEKVTKPEDVKAFMIGRYKSYQSFADFMLSQYFLKDEPRINPTPAMKKYLSDYRAVMKNANDPIYFAVALLPCSRLWVWLSNKVDIPNTSPYYTWKKDNMSGHPEKHYKALLNKHLNTSEKVQKANAIFRMQMQNENNFFASS
ncbi:hypothetical protein NFI96_011865 [Prochilodus magdalenae]|nr:hypothetical protein NFI96_011865 [Prochilodus magdalenae]